MNISLLGSTGSIGRQTLEVVDLHPERIGHTTDSSNRAGCYIRRAPRKA